MGFFDMSMAVGLCFDTVCASWQLPPLAAAFNSDTVSFFEKIKETAALISQKLPYKNRHIKIPLLNNDLFSFAVVRQISYLIKDIGNIKMPFLLQ